jgi:hypothetical protein
LILGGFLKWRLVFGGALANLDLKLFVRLFVLLGQVYTIQHWVHLPVIEQIVPIAMRQTTFRWTVGQYALH